MRDTHDTDQLPVVPEAITVPNPLPPTVVALTPEAVQQVTAALDDVQRAVALGVTADTFADASAAYERAKKVAKAIEAGRQDVKRPVIDLGKAIDAAAKAAIVPLDNATAELGRLLLVEQKRANEERDRALAEQRRIEAERRAAEAEAAQANVMADILGSPELAPAPAVDPYPTPAPVPVVPERHKTVVRTVKRYRLEVVDARLVPRVMHDVDGNAYQLVVLDQAEITRAMKAGVEVPGCKLIVEEVPAAMGR